ncbi:alpha/beta fold hydrolase, partial [Singulisphaera rosea]
DDVFGLVNHLEGDRAYLFGLSFGTTITLSALHRRPELFPRAALQGGFAHRRFSAAERMALLLGRRLPGTSARLPFRNQALAISSKRHFPNGQADLWSFYLEQNGLTPIASLSQRLDLVSRLDLRPVLGEIPNELLLIQGDDDRIVGRPHFDELIAKLPGARGRLWPGVGHQPHYTHPEALAAMVGDWFDPGNSGH